MDFAAGVCLTCLSPVDEVIVCWHADVGLGLALFVLRLSDDTTNMSGHSR